jgi:hypothetical protein
VPANDPHKPEKAHPELGAQYGPTGVLFSPRTPEALQAAVQFFEANETLFNQAVLRRHAQQFDRHVFAQRVEQFLTTALTASDIVAYRNDGGWGTEERPANAQKA